MTAPTDSRISESAQVSELAQVSEPAQVSELAQSDVVDQLPAEVIAELEARQPDILRDLRNGTIDEIPDDVVDALPDTVANLIPDELLSGTSGTFLAVLAVIALLALGGFLYGIVKSAMKAAFFFLFVAVAAGALFLYL